MSLRTISQQHEDNKEDSAIACLTHRHSCGLAACWSPQVSTPLCKKEGPISAISSWALRRDHISYTFKQRKADCRQSSINLLLVPLTGAAQKRVGCLGRLSHTEVRWASRPAAPPGPQIIRGKKCEVHVAKCASHRDTVTDKQSSTIIVQITFESFSDSVINERWVTEITTVN